MRLEVSRKADLATRALIELASTGERAKAAVLADRLGTTAGFLTQVVAPLAARGWVRSEPGPTGGYRAVVGLDDVSVLDIIEAVEGPTDSGRCVLEDRACLSGGQCALHRPWMAARSKLLDELAGTSLAALPSARSRTRKDPS